MREAPSRRRAPARPVLRPDALADRLTRAVSAHGLSDRITVPMTALCTAVSMLGAPDSLLRNVLHGFATGDAAHTAEATRQLWREMVDSRPFLAGRIDPLVGWLDQECLEMDRTSPRIEALTECFAVLDRIDLPGTASQPGVDGELLGPTYSLLRSTGLRGRRNGRRHGEGDAPQRSGPNHVLLGAQRRRAPVRRPGRRELRRARTGLEHPAVSGQWAALGLWTSGRPAHHRPSARTS